MEHIQRALRSATSILCAVSLGLVPINDAMAAGADAAAAATARVQQNLAQGCGTDAQGRQIADVTGDPTDPNSGVTTSGAGDASDANGQAGATATASPEPAITAPPIHGILRGPGVLVAPPPSQAPSLAPPPVPTPTPESTSVAPPVFLIRASASPVPSASPTPANNLATAPSTDASNATDTAAPGATASAPATESSNVAPANNALGGAISGNPASGGGVNAGTNAGAGPANAPHASATGMPSPSPAPTLGPNQVAVLADDLTGYTNLDHPSDAVGNVHVFYREGVMVGDRAHYDGSRFIRLTGHTYLENNAHDTKLYADAIDFDLTTNHATLVHGTGRTSRGVDAGYIHYTADSLDSTANGKVHGQHATFSTCENPRGGYHISAKTIDITPGQKLVAKSAIVFLGALAIFFIPVLSIPLNRTAGERRPVVFAPEFGYDQADGVYVKARLGFGTTKNYYGYYRVEEFERRGLGLGYVAFIGSRNGRRQVNVNIYDFANRQSGGHDDNLSIQDNEAFTQALQGQFGATYTSEYGPYASLPPSYSFSGTVNHASKRSSQGYSFSRTAVGTTQSTINSAFQDGYQLSQSTNTALNLNYSENVNSYSGITTPTSSFHINSLTHSATKGADYTLTVDQTDSATPSGYNKVPEFMYHPHGGRGIIPLDTQLTVGTYHELTPLTLANGNVEPGREAQRSELDVTAGPALFNVFHSSTVSAVLGGSQYYYSTGDLKAQTRQTVNMTTPFGPHINNVIQYQEQNIAGPQSIPFQYLDVLGSVNHNAQETLSLSNGGIYTLTLTTGTAFDHQAEPISYQLISRPSSRSYVSVGGSYVPGIGNGFSTTNIQVATPFGRDQDLEFTTNVDWKSRGRLINKNVYFRKIVGNCYDIRLSYNQDLKAVNVSLDLLAFPTRGVNFGFVSQQQAIFPQNFAF